MTTITIIIFYIIPYLFGIVVSSAFFHRFTDWSISDKHAASFCWPVVFPLWSAVRLGKWLGENFVPPSICQTIKTRFENIFKGKR